MKWSCGLGIKTKVPVTDWENPREKHVHTIEDIKATALSDRKCQIEVQIRRLCIGPTTERKMILEMLSAGLWKHREELLRLDGGRAISVSNENEYSGIYTIGFCLENGEHFCDTVINIVEKAFTILGVEDAKGYRLTNFTTKQETFVRLEEAWISFDNWLRIRHRLPLMNI